MSFQKSSLWGRLVFSSAHRTNTRFCMSWSKNPENPNRYVYNHSKEDRFEKDLRTKLKARAKKKLWHEQIQTWRGHENFVKHLLENKIYEDENMIVLDKPRGMPMHIQDRSAFDEKGMNPDDVLSMNEVVSLLHEKLGVTHMKDIFSQPYAFGGVVVYSKSEEATAKFRKLFLHYRTQKFKHQKHRAVVLGDLKLDEENVQFPIYRQLTEDGDMIYQKATKHTTQRKLEGVNLMEFTFKQLGKVEFSRPKTTASVLEISSYTCKWDSIQLCLVAHHLCTALGDHRYSHRLISVAGKPLLLPVKQTGNHQQAQKLPEHIQKALHLKSLPDIINLPIHIYGSEVTLPKDIRYKGKNIQFLTFKAKMPEFFEKTISQLGMELLPDVSVGPKVVYCKKHTQRKTKSTKSSLDDTTQDKAPIITDAV